MIQARDKITVEDWEEIMCGRGLSSGTNSDDLEYPWRSL